MNRIYQGRVSAVETADGKDERDNPNWKKLEDWQSALWQHHELFQDAVNYYLIALLALADESNEMIFAIRRRLAEVDAKGQPTDEHVWTRVRRNGVVRPGMRDSIARWLGVNKTSATPEDCFKAVLVGNTCGKDILNLALLELLAECSGDSAIQQKGRAMLPRFCDAAYKGEYPHTKTALGKAASKEQLPILLHAPDAADRIDTLAEKLDFTFFANMNTGVAPFSCDNAKAKLEEALKFVAERCPDVNHRKAALHDKIKSLSPDRTFPAYHGGSINKEALKLRFFAYLLFVYVEQSGATFGALRGAFPIPREKKVSTKATDAGKVDFFKFGNDPIRLARGTRGYVFPAFTSLSSWGGQDRNEPMWKEFDIAAFKEALKALHQIEAKGKERTKERTKIEFRLACMNGDARWKSSGEEEETPPPVFKGDPRIKRLISILDTDLAQEYELTEGQPVTYGLHPRTIRGFRDLRITWNRIAPQGTSATDKVREQLVKSLRSYQRDNTYSVGSVRLFEELLKYDNWLVWQEPSVETQTSWRKNGGLRDDAEFARDPVAALTEARQMEREVERLKEPIRFTPADPQYSRRQFYFSDVCKFTERGDYQHERNSQNVIVPMAVEQDGVFKDQRVRLHYSAPRLLRDHLRQGQDENLHVAPFLQPMMEALGFSNEMPQDISDHAVALMPEILPSGDTRILLNFPITLDTTALMERLGRWQIWEKQFANFDDVNFYLRWPTQTSGINTPHQGWWWDIVESFSSLSVDLGQRDAGAFSVLDVRSNHDFGKKPAREIGITEGKVWRAAVSETGLLRLPGEDAKVPRDGMLQTEFYGEKGRMSEPWEWEEALDIARGLRPDIEPQRFVGHSQNELSFPEQNDGLLRCFRHAQSRLARLQSLSWRLRDKERIAEVVADMEEDEEFKPLLDSLPQLRPPELIAQAVCDQLIGLRDLLQSKLGLLANRVLPLRDRNWEWIKRSDNSGCHLLRRTSRGTAKNSRKVMGQRGLSLERIEQIEGLRRRAQALNRALTQQPGVKPVLGRATRGAELPDPCPEILDKLERTKDQRINQTAHLILARALGVRLTAPSKDKVERTAKDIHGEYEKFRAPVDFVVLEDLSRYLSSQDRAPSENSRLMKWCHRAVLHKLKELCEPYGIPVVEATAAYSSRFCSRSGVAGFRAQELTSAAKREWRWQQQLAQLERHERGETRLEPVRAKRLQDLKALFDVLDKINEARSGKKPRTLIAPLPGGPIFIPAKGPAMQADINAAINIGLRAIASPDNHTIQVRIRSRFDDNQFIVRADTKREKARWGTRPPRIQMLQIKDAESLGKSRNPNFFVDHGRVAHYDQASIESLPVSVASGRGIWGTLRQREWEVVNRLNNDRLEKWGFGRPLNHRANSWQKDDFNLDWQDDFPV